MRDLGVLETCINKLDKTIALGACCQPAEITGFPPVFNSQSDLQNKPNQRLLITARPKTLSHFRNCRKIRRMPKRKTTQKLKIAWRLCYSRKPFRELCPRMRTPERGQLEAYTIGCQKPPRGFSGQPQTHSHLSSTRSFIPNGSGLCKGGIKKVTVWGSAAVPAGVLARRAEREARSGQPARCRRYN